ncbi:AAA family ATPase [Streptomyces regalis]|uniref:Uncharacterized protein n=1 Tax=Streptomyces regalis TaxID=68262 RepID=A0A124G722_9ACTN|nr:AAA family ATPase [Streptomyces regalis]KUL21446.1 hypothetical protein ADL12_44685 [Streptomyces regalis]
MNEYGYEEYQAEDIPDWGGESWGWDQMMQAADTEEDFIIPDIASAETTALVGKSVIGKSWMVSHIIACSQTGEKVFGEIEMADRDWKVAILGTDNKPHKEYGKRIRTAVPVGMTPNVRTFDLPVMDAEQKWKSLRKTLVANAFNLVVIDSYTQSVGDFNDNERVTRYFNGLELLVKAGIAVFIVAHESEKGGGGGSALGSSLFKQKVRSHISVTKQRRGNLKLFIENNASEEHHYIHLKAGVGARYTITERYTETEAEERSARASQENKARQRAAQEDKRNRETATLNDNRDKAQFVVDFYASQAKTPSKAAVARAMTEKFQGSEGTYKVALSSGQGFGAMLAWDASGRPTMKQES